MKNINQELIALFDKYGSDRRRPRRENKKLSYLYALADLRENLLDWCQFDPEQQALQIGADAGALTGLLARRLSSVTVLDVLRRKSGGSTPSFQDRAGAGGEDPLCLCGCGDICEGSGKARRDIWICSADREFDGGR